jgi:hypothetical protein
MDYDAVDLITLVTKIGYFDLNRRFNSLAPNKTRTMKKFASVGVGHADG